MGHSIYHPTAERRSANERAVDAYVSLRDAMEDALQHDPSRKVPTPGYGPKHRETPADDVILDNFSGTGDSSLMELLQLVAAAAKGDDVQARASLWISVQAAKFAKNHRDDLLAEDD
jgi:hypothetical protein